MCLIKTVGNKLLSSVKAYKIINCIVILVWKWTQDILLLSFMFTAGYYYPGYAGHYGGYGYAAHGYKPYVNYPYNGGYQGYNSYPYATTYSAYPQTVYPYNTGYYPYNQYVHKGYYPYNAGYGYDDGKYYTGKYGSYYWVNFTKFVCSSMRASKNILLL